MVHDQKPAKNKEEYSVKITFFKKDFQKPTQCVGCGKKDAPRIYEVSTIQNFGFFEKTYKFPFPVCEECYTDYETMKKRLSWGGIGLLFALGACWIVYTILQSFNILALLFTLFIVYYLTRELIMFIVKRTSPKPLLDRYERVIHSVTIKRFSRNLVNGEQLVVFSFHDKPYADAFARLNNSTQEK